MVRLIDTNVIIRFLVGDHEEHSKKAKEIFLDVQKGKLQILILDSVIMETFFVLTKFYKLPKSEVIGDLKAILSLEGVVNSDKVILTDTLNLIESKNIDFVDALICTKSKLQGFGKISFGKDVYKKC